MEGRFKEQLDFRSVVFHAMIGYIDCTGDPDLHDKRDCRLVNMYPLVKVWARGRHDGVDYDFTEEQKRLYEERIGTKDAKEKVRIDAERFGVFVEILEKAGLLPKRVPSYGLGVKHPEEIDALVEEAEPLEDD